MLYSTLSSSTISREQDVIIVECIVIVRGKTSWVRVKSYLSLSEHKTHTTMFIEHDIHRTYGGWGELERSYTLVFIAPP